MSTSRTLRPSCKNLADVFIGEAISDKLKALSSGSGPGNMPAASSLTPTAENFVFLNNALLEAGHAVRYDGDEKN